MVDGMPQGIWLIPCTQGPTIHLDGVRLLPRAVLRVCRHAYLVYRVAACAKMALYAGRRSQAPHPAPAGPHARSSGCYVPPAVFAPR